MGFKAPWLCQHKAQGGPSEALLPPALGTPARGPRSPAAWGHSKLLIFISLA